MSETEHDVKHQVLSATSTREPGHDVKHLLAKSADECQVMLASFSFTHRANDELLPVVGATSDIMGNQSHSGTLM